MNQRAGGRTRAERAANSHFRRAWLALSFSIFGAEVTALAIPLIAVVQLGGGAAELGTLSLLQRLPAIAVGLFAGVLLDRVRRRRALIAADLVRALVLLVVPVAFWTGDLTIALLYVVSVAVGSLGVFSDVGYQCYLPTIVTREQLVDGNSKFEMSRAVSEIGGPGLAGVIVSAFTAAGAMLVQVFTSLAAASTLAMVRKQEPPVAARDGRALEGVLAEVKDGLRVTWRQAMLRALAVSAALFNLFVVVVLTLIVLFLERDLGLDPSAIGMAFGAAGAGAVAVTVAGARVLGGDGIGKHAIVGAVVATAGLAILAALMPGTLATLPLLLTAMALLGAGTQIFNIAAVTVRQLVTPDALLGRIIGSARFIGSLAAPLGAVAAGALGEALGVRPTMAIAALGSMSAVVYLLRSPIRPAQRSELTQQET